MIEPWPECQPKESGPYDTDGGTGSPLLGEPLGRETLTHSLLEKVRTPSGKPGWGKIRNMHKI